jgi:3-oxoacyl-[acyl-carrier protein] reductase
MRLSNKVAIITGGARGIGKSAADVFTKEGATVIIWDLLPEGEKTVADLRAAGYVADFQQLSVTNVPAIEAAVQKNIATYGKIDILINNAGITRDKSFMKMSHPEWQQVIEYTTDFGFGIADCRMC